MNAQFVSLLEAAQSHISRNYAASISDPSKLPQLRSYIEKYIRDQDASIPGMESAELVDRLYREMAEYSILTPTWEEMILRKLTSTAGMMWPSPTQTVTLKRQQNISSPPAMR